MILGLRTVYPTGLWFCTYSCSHGDLKKVRPIESSSFQKLWLKQ